MGVALEVNLGLCVCEVSILLTEPNAQTPNLLIEETEVMSYMQDTHLQVCGLSLLLRKNHVCHWDLQRVCSDDPFLIQHAKANTPSTP